ncbi:hypothetical protein KJ575_05360 [Patescibacteria group bacterium]|nr:hypothetical protein [Patescibacteria group bacterium]MBU4142284.1 hypothetical protein [Patescibacteria group bacterium]MBU4369106.1 hypothetical protein [Patescibacteria group bacterium]
MVYYKSYHELDIYEFYKLIDWENARNKHHVFPGRLITGASAKAQLSRKEMEIKFGINLRETKLVPVAAHCFYNDLFRNSSPFATLGKLHSLVCGDYTLYESKKKSFVKFSLCVARQEIEEEFAGMAEAVKILDIDVNNGNEIRVEDILPALKLKEEDMASYLRKKFFPENYKKYCPMLWDLYL